MSVPGCHLCGSDALHEITAFRKLRRITSDFRPWPDGGRLAVCRRCAAVQKIATAQWRRECRDIYASYVVYPQGGGSEQAVFASSGAGEARSRLILRRLIDGCGLPESGRHLDFGCGDGSLLRNAAVLMPAWRRAGAELNEARRPEIEAISGVEAFFAGDPAGIPAHFDLVSAVHVLEHFEEPSAIARVLAGKLADGGILAIQTPDLRTNPFDLLIADHATHFTAPTLHACLTAAGQRVETLTDDWVPRELSVVARRGPADRPPASAPWADMLEMVERHLGWLERLRTAAADAARTGSFGLFGTSIAATWLFGEISDSVSFFVDEDSARAGTTYHDRPVLHPADVPADGRVLIAHTPGFAVTVAERLEALGRFAVVHPPAMDHPAAADGIRP